MEKILIIIFVIFVLMYFSSFTKKDFLNSFLFLRNKDEEGDDAPKNRMQRAADGTIGFILGIIRLIAVLIAITLVAYSLHQLQN